MALDTEVKYIYKEHFKGDKKSKDYATYSHNFQEGDNYLSWIKIDELLIINNLSESEDSISDQRESIKKIENEIKYKIYKNIRPNDNLLRKNLYYPILATNFALINTNLKNKTIINLNCIDDTANLLSYAKGAKEIFVINENLNDEDKIRFRDNIDINWSKDDELSLNKSIIFMDGNIERKAYGYSLLSSLKSHGFFSTMCALITGNFKPIIPRVMTRLPFDNIDVVIADIGPNFGDLHLKAIDLTRYMKNVKKCIIAGYTNKGDLNPTEAIRYAEDYGFREKQRFIVNNCQTSLVLER